MARLSRYLRRHPKLKGQGLVDVGTDVIEILVLLFVGLFLIAQVITITAINNTSSLYSTFTALSTSVGTVYNIFILVLLVVLFAIAITALRGIGGRGGGYGETAV